jgi:hypothetical protein
MRRCGQYIAVYLFWRFFAFETHVGCGSGSESPLAHRAAAPVEAPIPVGP